MNFKLLLIILGVFSLYAACNDKACETVSCENNGECNDGLCYCFTGYTGDKCQYKTCDAIACGANMVCFPTGQWGAGACKCDIGYEGATCTTLSRYKFLGAYNGIQTCTTLPNEETDWAINESLATGILDFHLYRADMLWASPIFLSIIDSVNFQLFEQFSSIHNDGIHPLGFGRYNGDGSININFVLLSSLDTCQLHLMPQ